MIGMEYFVAGHSNPVGIFGWLFVLEAFGDDVGHSVAERLDTSLSLGGNATEFLGGHGNADRDHIREILEVLDRHMKDPRDLGDTLHIAGVSRELYLGILDESLGEMKRCV
jgi:heme oxygenase